MNSIHKKPVVVGDEIKIIECINMNMVVDHRYIDGGRSTGLNKLVIIYLISLKAKIYFIL